MDLEKIKALINLTANSQLSELELEEGECRLRISRDGVATTHKALKPDALAIQAVATSVPASVTTPLSSPQQDMIAEGYTVAAPMFGVFCLKPAPTEAPFVQVGDMVKKGQKICMIEAMKLFHSLEADRAGRIVEILVEHGQEVDAGQPLLRIE